MGKHFCICEYCKKNIGKFAIDTFVNGFKGYSSDGKRKLFCNEDCYNKYVQQFEITIYNGKPIYAIKYNDEVRYMPYWFSGYYFIDIESCKRRMDANFAISLL